MNHSDTTTDGHHQKKMYIKLTSDKNLCHPTMKVKQLKHQLVDLTSSMENREGRKLLILWWKYSIYWE
jgi:hypothetical protein